VTITDSVKLLHRKRIEAGIGHTVEPVIIENYRETLRKAGIGDDEIQQRLVEIAPEFEV
jgi:hypothetical protein